MYEKNKVVMLLAAIVLVVVVARFEYSKSRANVVRVLIDTPQLQSVDIGSYNNLENGQRAAIKELSRQAKLHPNVAQFFVYLRNEKPQKVGEEIVRLWWLRADEALLQDFLYYDTVWHFDTFSFWQAQEFAHNNSGLLFNHAKDKNIHEASQRHMTIAEMMKRWTRYE